MSCLVFQTECGHVICSLCPTPAFQPQRHLYNKVKPQHGCHLPPGGAPNIHFLPFLKKKLFLALLGAVDINWQVDEKTILCPCPMYKMR